MNQKISTFRSITNDDNIIESEVVKFLKWGKGDLQQALNYYYVHLEKGKIKRTNKKQEKKQEQVIEKKEEKIITLDVSQSQENSQDAFSILRRGSVKHQKTQDFIDSVRKIYQLPIKGKQQRELIHNSNSSVLSLTQQYDCEEFQMVDSLHEVFDGSKPLQISEKMVNEGKQNQQVGFQKINQSQQFEDFQNFQYKHVYTNRSLLNDDQQILDKKQKNQEKQIVQQQIKTKTKIKQNQNAKNNNPKTKKNQSFKFTNNHPKKQIIEQKDSKQTASLTQKNSTTVSLQKKKQEKYQISQDYPFCETMNDPEIYSGEYFIQAFCTEKKKFDNLYVGRPVEIVGHIEDLKTKKKTFGKKKQRTMSMRIYLENKPIGRLKDDEVRILMPLIDQQLIRAEFFIQQFPLFSDTFKPITIKAKIYFLPKLITQPKVESFEPNERDRERVHEISGLLTKLCLPLLIQPLVKVKSKYIRNQNKSKKVKQSIDLFNFKEESLKNEREKQKLVEEEIQRKRKQTDPLYRSVQKSIWDMKGGRNKDAENVVEDKDNVNDGGVQKKIIEIDTKQQKDKFSELIELHEENIEPFYPSKNFVSQLYPYQALALSWMLKKEGYSEIKKDQEQIHPLWSEYSIPACPKYRIFFNQLTGQMCVRRPISKIQCKGGILADEMGLGKTVMMAALIVSNIQNKSKDRIKGGGTLVVLPLTLLSQWQAQISKHTTGVNVCIYYSIDRKKIESNLHKFDVVLTTYGTVSHEFSQGNHIKKTGIYKYNWHRIILDEAHYIKGRIIQTSKAVYELNGRHRWCLTGTPIQNTVCDLFSLLHFIKYTPWSQFACWSRFIAKPLEEGDQSIYSVLKTILKRVFLRRTKNSEDSEGKSIIELPPRISKVELLTMSNKERQFYDSVYRASRSDFDALIERGILEAKYMQVLEMLMRLRQICCHPVLFKSITKYTRNVNEFSVELKKLIEKSREREEVNCESQNYFEPLIDLEFEEERVKASSYGGKQISQDYFNQVVQKVESGDLDCCTICLNQPEDPVITSCLHIFCKSCNIRQVEEKRFCGFCRNPLTKQSFIHLPRQNRLNTKMDQIFLSTKMIALNEHLSQLDKQDKVVIFTQFLGMMDLLEVQFKKNKFAYVRMEGRNTHKERTKIVKAFQNDPKVQIFLVSLKTAGVGLNLVAANKVFLLDPWWNPAVEEQAIERVHRIGQKRTVQIFRFIMDKSIETRMLELNTEKKQLSQNVLSHSNSEDTNIKQKVQKLKYLMENY